MGSFVPSSRWGHNILCICYMTAVLLQPPVSEAECKTMCRLQMQQKEAVCLVPALNHCNHFRPVLKSFFQLQVIPDASLQPLVQEALLQFKPLTLTTKPLGPRDKTFFLKVIQHCKNLSVNIRWIQHLTIFRKQRKPSSWRMLSIRRTTCFKFQALSSPQKATKHRLSFDPKQAEMLDTAEIQ